MRMLSPLSTGWSRRALSPDLVGNVFEDFDRMVDTFLRPTYASTVGFTPSCDIDETKDHYLASFDIPGLKKEDIKVEVQGNKLVISGERHREMKSEEGEATLRHERAYGKFERTFELSALINADKIEAQYENGVLNIALQKPMLPKAEQFKFKRVRATSSVNFWVQKKREPKS